MQKKSFLYMYIHKYLDSDYIFVVLSWYTTKVHLNQATFEQGFFFF